MGSEEVSLDRVRVLVADDDPEMREALIDLIDREASLDLIGVAEDAWEAIELAERHRPEVALVDVRMPEGGGSTVAKELRDRSADTRVIAVSSGEERQAILRLLAAGVAGYLVRGAPPEEFLRAIRESVEGRATFSRRSSPPSSKRSAAISKGERTSRRRSSAGRHARTESSRGRGSRWLCNPSWTSRTATSWGSRHWPASSCIPTGGRAAGSRRPRP